MPLFYLIRFSYSLRRIYILDTDVEGGLSADDNLTDGDCGSVRGIFELGSLSSTLSFTVLSVLFPARRCVQYQTLIR